MSAAIRVFIQCLLIALICFSCQSKKSTKSAVITNSSFEIERGVNISHWLSQSKKRGDERTATITEKDIKKIASLGYDHIRLPLDEEHLWDEEGQKDTIAFALVHKALAWCEKHDLRAILDLHIVRSHYFNASHNPLWDDEAEQLKFVGFWSQLSDEFNAYSNADVAYELLNEAVADNPESWNDLIAKAMKEIRSKEPERTVIIGSNRWQSVHTFNQLKVPENDSNIILSFHYYSPHVFTHYKAPWSKKVGFYTGPVHYPGVTIKDEDLKGYSKEQINSLTHDKADYNKAYILERLQQPLQMADSLGLKLFCGEFGCYPTTDIDDRVAWYSDLTQVFEENGIAWANWDYKGGFGVVDSNGEPRIEILNAIIPQKNK